MKPVSLCLVQMGSKGLEMVKAYPKVIPSPIENEIITKSMPMGAKAGDFTSSVISSDSAFSGYVFTVPKVNERDNIASIVAVFDNSNYDTNNVRKLFSVLIEELQKQNVVSMEILQQILPSLYNGFDSKNVKIKISSIVTVEINFDDDKKDPNESEIKKAAKSLAEDMWK